jgi:hypothetical protein
MQARYERLALDATKHAANPAQEASELPVVVLAMNNQGELLRGMLLDDSIYHFFIVKTYKIQIHDTKRATERPAETMSIANVGLPPTKQSGDGKNDGTSPLYVILLICLVFLVSRALHVNGFK